MGCMAGLSRDYLGIILDIYMCMGTITISDLMSSVSALCMWCVCVGVCVCVCILIFDFFKSQRFGIITGNRFSRDRRLYIPSEGCGAIAPTQLKMSDLYKQRQTKTQKHGFEKSRVRKRARSQANQVRCRFAGTASVSVSGG